LISTLREEEAVEAFILVLIFFFVFDWVCWDYGGERKCRVE